jgi:hypothetical protein
MIKQYICETLRETPSPDASFDHVILSYCVTASGTRHQTKPSNHAFRYFDDVPTHVRDYQLDLNHTSAQPPDQRCLCNACGTQKDLCQCEKQWMRGELPTGSRLAWNPKTPCFSICRHSLGCCTAQRSIQQEFRRFLTGSRRRSEPASHLYLHSGARGITLSSDGVPSHPGLYLLLEMFLGYGFGYGRKDVLARQIPMRNFPRGSEEMTFGSNKEQVPQQKLDG